jgi:predicted transposase/invertase (TIGR01784 family)
MEQTPLQPDKSFERLNPLNDYLFVKDMGQRSLFYWSREYTKSLEAGQDYLELPNVVAINIVNFEFFPAGDFHTSFHLREDREKDLILTNALEIHFLDMVKFKGVGEKDIRNDPLQRRLVWLDRSRSLLRFAPKIV